MCSSYSSLPGNAVQGGKVPAWAKRFLSLYMGHNAEVIHGHVA